jgi:hypothetical protein
MTDNALGWEDATFRRSSFSGSSGGNCVEVARTGDLFGLRDSKNPGGPVLALGAHQGRAFLESIKGEHH